jgi:putative transposase
MARRPRLQFPGAVYHVMSRGNRKSTIYEDDHDRRRFMNLLAQTVIRYEVRVYAACLMGTHYHALLDTPRNNLSDAMQQLNGDYSQTYNQRHDRSGHTLEARFHSTVVQREVYLRRAARYVVFNPVKGGLCARVSDWPWSTYRATAGLEAPPGWLYLDWLEWAFRATSRADAQKRYRRYVNSPSASKSEIELNALVFGTQAFRAKAIELSNASLIDRRLPEAPPMPEPPPLEAIFGDISTCPEKRNDRIHTAHVNHGYHLAAIARYLQMNADTVRRAFQRHQRRSRP